MPFSGNKWSDDKFVAYPAMLRLIHDKWPEMTRAPDVANDTAKTFIIPGLFYLYCRN